jgi:hypothetical protein
LPGSLPGALDLVTASGSTDAVSVRLGDGAGGFAGATEVRVGAGPESVALGDLDRDGRLDLVTANLPAASGRSGMSLFLGAQKKGRDAGAGAPRSKACHGDTAPPSAGTSRPRDGGLRQVLAAAMTGLNTMSRAVSCNSAVDANGAVTHVVDTLSTGLEVRR